MEAWKSCILVLGLVLLVAVQSGLSIKCFVCNSGEKYHGDSCEYPDQLKDSYLKDCADQEKEDHVTNGTYIKCRIFEQNVRGEHRLIRQCASGGRTDKCIERTGTKGIKLTYCHCDIDGCNSASSLYTPITLLVTVMMAVWGVAQRT